MSSIENTYTYNDGSKNARIRVLINIYYCANIFYDLFGRVRKKQLLCSRNEKRQSCCRLSASWSWRQWREKGGMFVLAK